MNIRYLTVQEVIAIQVAMIQKHSEGEQIGVKVSSLLESAVLRPQSSAFGDEAYPSIREKAAALFEYLGQNHPFQNANKRTAFTVDIVNHKYSSEQLTSIIEAHSCSII